VGEETKKKATAAPPPPAPPSVARTIFRSINQGNAAPLK
jgi:hypothetical protein